MLPTDLPSREHALVAILRGVAPAQVVSIAALLHKAGIRIIEVPLNSPEPYASIAALAASHGAECLIGAGTVLTVEQVQRTHTAGARLVVAPNCDAAVIREALRLGMQMMPGIATATEAWMAAGAAGFGLGSELYRPTYSLGDIEQRARTLVAAYRSARAAS